MANKKKGEIVPSNSLVQDEVTGFEGIVIFRIEYMNECIRYAVQPKINSEGKLPEYKVIDGPNLKIIAPPPAGLSAIPETPDAFDFGVKLKDRLSGVEGVAVIRFKNRHAGDRYGIQPKINEKGDIPDVVFLDEEDLEQIDPLPKPKKEKKEKRPNGPHGYTALFIR